MDVMGPRPVEPRPAPRRTSANVAVVIDVVVAPEFICTEKG